MIGIEGRPETLSGKVEIENVSPLHQLFARLSSPETAQLVTPVEVEALRSQMEIELQEMGVDLAILKDQTSQQALQERQLRHLDQGKGLALARAMPGNTVPQYQDWAQAQSVNLPKLEKGDDTSRSRGLMQLLANTLAFASGAINAEAYLRDVKWRVGAAYERPLKKRTEKAQGVGRDKLRQILRETRVAFDIPGPKDPLRVEYTGYSRIAPEPLRAFWGTLKEICLTKWCYNNQVNLKSYRNGGGSVPIFCKFKV